MTRFYQRIFNERQTGFIRIFHAKLGLRYDFQTQLCKQLFKFPQFPLDYC
jgi:hypothetical protein